MSYSRITKTRRTEPVSTVPSVIARSAGGPGAAVSTLGAGHAFERVNVRAQAGGALQRDMAARDPAARDPAARDPAARDPADADASLAAENIAARSVSDAVADGTRGGGQPLDAEARSFLEPRFGHDFSQVRVHADSSADDSAGALAANAYAVGSDVVFAAGQYNPGTSGGRRLLAHELTHVVQQGGATSTASTGAAPASSQTAAREMVQRDGAPKLTSGDWEFSPTWSGETDDRYDNQQNLDRAREKEANERGQSATPNKWWTTPTPTPAPKPGSLGDPNTWQPKDKGPEQPPPVPVPWQPQGTGIYPSPPPAAVPLGPGDFPVPSGDERYA